MKNILVILCALIISSTTIIAQNLVVRDRINFTPNASDVWGYVDGDTEYALIGLVNGTSVVDVTDPDDIFKVQHVFGNTCIWRDIKVFGQYAYVVNDCSSQNAGMDILDLGYLPDSISKTPWRTDGTTPILRRAHNIFIDENGYAYLCGYNFGGKGVLILDLNVDPLDPPVLGEYADAYVHDIFVRNDTLWTAEISAGRFSVIDVTDKSNPVVLARQITPVQDCHNIWISDDGNTAFTTDETTNPNVSVASFDVSDLDDIQLLDEYKTDPNSTPHNAHVFNDFVVISHYAEGVKILDASLPDEMVEVGSYDTAPNEEGLGYEGCWGAYPYLPSGNILAGDQQEGLYVLTPTYLKAVHIRGNVSDAITGSNLFNASVTITESTDTVGDLSTDLDGNFQKGFATSSVYSVEIALSGYVTYTSSHTLLHGDILQLDIELVPEMQPTDTIYADVFAENTVIICDEEISGEDVSFAILCDYENESAIGSWLINEDGCLEYTANDTAGNFIDSLCFIVNSGDGNQTNVNIVIVSVMENVTAVDQNVFDTDEIRLLQNPVNNILYLKNSMNDEIALSINIFDVKGSHLINKEDFGFNNLISIELGHLSKGMYILTIQSEDRNLGHVKFIKN